jgi:hypothetical protein
MIITSAGVPASWLVVIGGEVDGLDGGAEQMPASRRRNRVSAGGP